jgi:hypothetical protein
MGGKQSGGGTGVQAYYGTAREKVGSVGSTYLFSNAMTLQLWPRGLQLECRFLILISLGPRGVRREHAVAGTLAALSRVDEAEALRGFGRVVGRTCVKPNHHHPVPPETACEGNR